MNKQQTALVAFARGEVATTSDVRRLLQQGNIQCAQSVVKRLAKAELIEGVGWGELPHDSPVRLRRGSKLARCYVVTQRGLEAARELTEL
jgi:hypothetical protein